MKVRITHLLLLLLGIALQSQMVANGFVKSSVSWFSKYGYFISDYQYYKPMIANIRTSGNHMRLYRADELEFSNSTTSDPHKFFDASFGEFFPLFGFHFGDTTGRGALKRAGVTIFIDGAAHVLLDLDTESNDIINTDYRIGMGISSRLPGALDNFSLRLKGFHESTHIGDEFTLHAAPQPEFRRYNISYEALELYAALDEFRSWEKALSILPNLRRPNIMYMRTYIGYRGLTSGEYSGSDGDNKPAEPILATKNELQFGGEIYFRGWPPTSDRASANRCWLNKLFAPQNIVFAVDFYNRDQYDRVNPRRNLSKNIVLGIIYGKSFAISSEPTVKWLLSYYEGVNPHGQFRQYDLKYWSIDYVIDF